MSNQNQIDIKISNTEMFETCHTDSNECSVVFKSFKASTLLNTATHDGQLFSSWITMVDGKLFCPADDHEVDFADEYHGEDIPLVPMEAIYICANKNDLLLSTALANKLKELISGEFGVDLSGLPIINEDSHVKN